MMNLLLILIIVLLLVATALSVYLSIRLYMMERDGRELSPSTIISIFCSLALFTSVLFVAVAAIPIHYGENTDSLNKDYSFLLISSYIPSSLVVISLVIAAITSANLSSALQEETLLQWGWQLAFTITAISVTCIALIIIHALSRSLFTYNCNKNQRYTLDQDAVDFD